MFLEINKREYWRFIPGFYGTHSASNFGAIRDNISNRFIYPRESNGYMVVTISSKVYSVHRVIANTFLRPQKGKYEINHINGDKSDNRVENLEYVTHLENMKHAVAEKLHIPTETIWAGHPNLIPFRANLTIEEIKPKVIAMWQMGMKKEEIKRALLTQMHKINKIVAEYELTISDSEPAI